MDVAVVYESMFGMTHDVADAVAEGVASTLPDAHVVCLPVGDAAPERLGTPDLLIVGGPTHMRGLSSGMSRKMAVSMEEKADRGEGEHQRHGLEADVGVTGLRSWFTSCPRRGRATSPRRSTPAGDGGAIVGSAARGIQHRLKRHGYRVVGEPEGFVVEGDAASCVPANVSAPARGRRRPPATRRTWRLAPRGPPDAGGALYCGGASAGPRRSGRSRVRAGRPGRRRCRG